MGDFYRAMTGQLGQLEAMWRQNGNVPFRQSRNVPLISDRPLPFPLACIMPLAAEPVMGCLNVFGMAVNLLEPRFAMAGVGFPGESSGWPPLS
jgi:hypothetical protein